MSVQPEVADSPEPAKKTRRRPSEEWSDDISLVWVDDRSLEARTPISRVTWKLWRAKGEGPPWYRVGRRVVYKWSEVEQWLSAGRVA
jgi:hypothetical protein